MKTSSYLIALFVGLGCAPERGPAGRTSRARVSLDTVSMDVFEYVGPGSMGRFTDYDRHPTWRDVLAAGSDVGGLYLSADGGESWTNVTRNLPSMGAWAVRFVVESGAETETTRLVLGGDSGLFVSNDLDTTLGLDPDALTGWTEVAGLERGDALPDTTDVLKLSAFHRSQHALTVFTLAVSPSDPDIVWAGAAAGAQVNLAQSANDPASLQRFDRWKVFRSTDGGATFGPALRFSEPIPSFVATPYDSAGSVFSILVDPDDAARVWVASDRGLYRSENADTTEDADGDGYPDLVWEEVGAAAARSTTDLGVTWTEEAPSCADYEDAPDEGAWCLPIATSAKVRFALDPETGWPSPGYEDHPNLRALAVSSVDGVETLFAAVWDRGHAADAPADCSDLVDGDSFVDTKLEFYRGGVYASEDGGQRWTWLYTSNGAPGVDKVATPYLEDRVYRCDAHTSERNSSGRISFMGDVDARPDDGEGPLLIAGGLGAGAGLYAYDPAASSPWTWLTDPADGDWSERFEGGTTQAISGSAAAEVSRLLVDWDARADGYPEVAFSHRGILLGSWDREDGRYEFEHLGSDAVGEDGDMTLWVGTGLDDAVVWDAVVAGSEVYVAVSDGAMFRAEEGSGAWRYANVADAFWTPNWSSDPGELRVDEARALAYDEESETVYVGAFVASQPSSGSVLAGSGTSWSVIGGYGYTSERSSRTTLDADHTNGLYSDSAIAPIELNRLLAFPASHGLDTDLLAATSDGLWAWDAEASGAQWRRICEPLSNGDTISDLAYDEDLVPGFAFATNEDARVGGLLAIDLRDLSCEAIEVSSYSDYESGALVTGKDPVRFASAVALAEDADTEEPRLVVGVTFNSYPGLLSGEIDCDDDGCALDSWEHAWTAEGYYEPDSHQDLASRKLDITDIAVDPLNKGVVGAALGNTPSTDLYNPEVLVWSEDGGATFAEVDFAADDHGLPNRGLKRLSFSDDGAWLFAASSSSLYRMPVGW